ncbi:glucoamylase family protein [Stakelama sediminis]|uniref:Glycoamylase-like domain-containing protein n=1 Tax=Stakelama sediminis TaxID=463200 RepID=A0A840Z284_9SPHN|nr:glucoamylase family protein [Stakelama sediminis]MBB5720003.1 hypothetical protein [Stakelama sediminis]
MTLSLNRRTLVTGAGAAFAAGAVSGPVQAMRAMQGKAGSSVLPAEFREIERRTLLYFLNTANSENGLIPDRYPSKSYCSIAAIGFGLTAYGIGVQRGWIKRADARQRTLTTLRFLSRLPMGSAAQGVAGYKGFFYHFLDMKTGLRAGKTELSTVDTSLMQMGILFATGFFDGDHRDEREIRRLGTELVEAADWNWWQQDGPGISMGWHPESGFIERRWTGYNEGKLVYVLALGSKRHPAADGSWKAWTATYPCFWKGEGDKRRLAFAPLFGSQYSEMWIDFRGIYDAPMRAAGFDYFENSRRNTYANRAYCTQNPLGWRGYSKDIWGLTACDGPGGFAIEHDELTRKYRGYSARGPINEPDGFDDGTIAPTAALGSLAFAPEISVPAGLAMLKQHGDRLFGEYGFRDSFNPSFRATDRDVRSGTVDAQHGWVANDWLGIDQGPILGAIANHEDDLVWSVMRRSPNIVRGLRRAGFSGGWLDKAPATPA